MIIARGLGKFCPMRASALVVADCSVASVGAPCEINSAGNFGRFAALVITGASVQTPADEIGVDSGIDTLALFSSGSRLAFMVFGVTDLEGFMLHLLGRAPVFQSV